MGFPLKTQVETVLRERLKSTYSCRSPSIERNTGPWTNGPKITGGNTARVYNFDATLLTTQNNNRQNKVG